MLVRAFVTVHPQRPHLQPSPRYPQALDTHKPSIPTHKPSIPTHKPSIPTCPRHPHAFNTRTLSGRSFEGSTRPRLQLTRVLGSTCACSRVQHQSGSVCSIVRIFRSITLSLSECRCVCNTGFTVIVFHRAPPPILIITVTRIQFEGTYACPRVQLTRGLGSTYARSKVHRMNVRGFNTRAF
ncbi:hypothetical protein BJV77DRAFT_160027 [Russula vinacea]|nr:hypothetical protein BJV77DRAFT_160027 [Russula vinacea]